MIRIAVDAMGGDFAPEATVNGALSCIEDPSCDFTIVLVGQEEKIRAHLQRLPANIEIVHASEVIEMHEQAAAQLKAKKDASIVKALTLHRERAVDAVISAGNTGAVMAVSTLLLGRIAGVSRPTIGAFLPSKNGKTLLVDAGANVDCKPQQLLEFGIMGSVFSELMLGIQQPRVGLLNVGEEEGKGNDATKTTYALMQNAPINFIGNIEGRDILGGKVDVAVCDGFIGNIILKFAESFPGLLKHMVRSFANKSPFHKIRLGIAAGSMKKMFREWDYQEYGGVPLLGLNGISLIGHGSSTPKAIKNMILQAKRMIDLRLNERIAQAMQQLHPAA